MSQLLNDLIGGVVMMIVIVPLGLVLYARERFPDKAVDEMDVIRAALSDIKDICIKHWQESAEAKVKTVAIILNMALLAFLAYLIFKGEVDREHLLNVALFIAAPVSALYALRDYSGIGWLALYFKRKAMEEQARINTLSIKPK